MFTVHDVIKKAREVIADRGPEYRYPRHQECLYFPENVDPEDYATPPTARCVFGEALHRLGVTRVTEGADVTSVLTKDLGLQVPDAISEVLERTQGTQDAYAPYSEVSAELEEGLRAAGYAA